MARALVLALLLSCAALAPARADDAERAFRKAMAAAGGDADKQEAAVRALGREGGGARLLARLAADPALDGRLRDAAAETFDGLSGDPAALAWAAAALAPGKGREKEGPVRALCAELIGAGLREHPERAEQLFPALQDESWSVQVAAIRSLVHVPRREVVGALAGLAGQAEGRVGLECQRALESLTGQKQPDGPAWAAWWAAQGAQWEPGAAPAAPAAEAGGTQTRRYEPGGSIFEDLSSHRVIIVVDVSGSMQVRALDGGDGARALTRLEAVQAELSRLIEEGLDEKRDQFNLIAFSSEVVPWKKKLVPASKANKEQALKFVRALKPEGETNISDALELAFQDKDADTIHFLTDGTPTRGKLTTNEEILGAVKRWNTGRGVRLCTVAFLAGDPTPFKVAENRGMSERFLRALSDANQGTFRLFDE